MKWRHLNRIAEVILLGIVILMAVIYTQANLQHYTAYLDSDIASDTLLAEVLASNHFVQPDTWVGSREVCIISAPNLAAFFYRLNGNLNFSMGLACVILGALFLVSEGFFLKCAGIGLKGILCAVCLTMVLGTNIHDVLEMFFLYAAYYTSHFISLFLILMIYVSFLRQRAVSGKTAVLVAVSFLFSVVNGLQGMHGTLYLYIPLFVTEFIRKVYFFLKQRHLRYSNKTAGFSILVWTFLLLVINLVTIHLSSSGLSDISRNIRHSWKKFSTVVFSDLLKVLGWDRSYSLILIFVLMGAAGFILAFGKRIYRISKKRNAGNGDDIILWPFVTIVFSLVVMVAAATFTTFQSAPRYYVPVVILVACGAALFIEEVPVEFGWIIFIPVCLYGILSVQDCRLSLLVHDYSAGSDESRVCSWMMDNGVNYGYSTFDNANSMTVRSQNRVKIRAVADLATMEGCKWLTDSTWYPPYRNAKQQTAYIVPESLDDHFEEFKNKNHPVITRQKKIGRFTVYVTDQDYTYWAK